MLGGVDALICPTAIGPRAVGTLYTERRCHGNALYREALPWVFRLSMTKVIQVACG